MTLTTRLLPIVLFIALAASEGIAQTSRERVSTPTPTPSPAITVTPSPTPRPVQTVEQLRSRISQRMMHPALRRGRVGVSIATLDGKTVFAQDADKYFLPASNMKNFTVAAAIERLTPDFRFVTSVFADAAPDGEGVVRGLRIFGRGDVSISTSFTNGDHYQRLDELARRIKAVGVRRIEGGITGDESHFRGSGFAPTWEAGDLQWYYGAQVSALPLNDNAVDLSVRAGAAGQPCVVTVTPPSTVVSIVNRCVTGRGASLSVNKLLDRNVIEVSGTMAPGSDAYRGYIAVSRPAEMFVALLKQRLEKEGIIVMGEARVLPPGAAAPPGQVEIVRFESPRFAEIAAKTMKPSQNLYTETILWTLGEQTRGGSSADSSTLGLQAVRSFLQESGIAPDEVVQYDGSGLSRRNLVTPASLVRLYTWMARQSRYSYAWMGSLTVGGVDGTLRNRFKGTTAAGNIRGKTGTLDQVSALTGYVTTAGGQQLVVSVIVNGVPELRERTSAIDDIVVALAAFDGRVD